MSLREAGGPIAEPGRNCWRIEHSDQVAFLVDTCEYFNAFVEVALRAERVLFILGWDVDPRVKLWHDDGGGREPPPDLESFLRWLVAHRPSLDVFVLPWRASVIYAFERDHLTRWTLGMENHPRLHVRYDDRHPALASHHQKVIVADDAVAFCGGIDLGRWRWDTPEHAVEDPRRRDPRGQPYPPFHDVQMMVTGAAACALGELCRVRWLRVTGNRVPMVARRKLEVPRVDAEDVPVAIARTLPRFAGAREVREVERLHLDAIAAAREDIYIESQYFTNRGLCNALAARLAEPEGPGVMLVLPESAPGWMERATMQVLRGRLLADLREADAHGRLRICAPIASDGAERKPINVHSKIEIVDDRFLRVGSANFSHRSMGLDTECDLAIDAGEDPRLRRVVATFRRRLLDEHLGGAVDDRPLRALDGACGERSRLVPIEPAPDHARWISETPAFDLPEPYAGEDVLAGIAPAAQARWRGWVKPMAVVGVALVVAAAWSWGSLGDWLEAGRIERWMEAAASYRFGWLLLVGAFVAGGLLMVPVTALTTLAGAAFGPVRGALLSLVGSALSAAVVYGIGRYVAADALDRVTGPKLAGVRRVLRRHSFVSVVIIRMVPIAPFSLLNALAGAVGLRFHNFVLGTVVGMIPGAVGLALFGDSLRAALREPSAGTVAFAVAVLAVIVAAGAIINRRLARRLDV